MDERGIEIRLTAEDVQKLTEALRGRSRDDEATEEESGTGMRVSSSPVARHCGVVICGG